MIVLLARLGLRAGEVAGLRLEDIDWHHGEIVVRGKGAKDERLPLLAEVGEAVSDYLLHARPTDTFHREVFCTVRAPRRRLTSPAVWAIVRAPAIALAFNDSGRTGCVMRWVRRWSLPRCRWRRSGRCCGTRTRRPRRATPVLTW